MIKGLWSGNRSRFIFLGFFLLALLLPWLPLGASNNYLLRIVTTALLYMILALEQTGWLTENHCYPL